MGIVLAVVLLVLLNILLILLFQYIHDHHVYMQNDMVSFFKRLEKNQRKILAKLEELERSKDETN